MVEANIDTWHRISRTLRVSEICMIKSRAVVGLRMMAADFNSCAMNVANTQQRRQAGDRQGQQDR